MFFSQFQVEFTSLYHQCQLSQPHLTGLRRLSLQLIAQWHCSRLPVSLCFCAGLTAGDSPDTALSFLRVWRNIWQVAFWLMWWRRAHTGSSDGGAAQLGGWWSCPVIGLSWAEDPQGALPTYYYSIVFSPLPSFPSRCPGCGQSVGQGQRWPSASALAPEGWLPFNCRRWRSQLWRLSYTPVRLYTSEGNSVFALWWLWLSWTCFYDVLFGRIVYE